MEGLSKEDQFLLKRLLEQVKGLRELIVEAQSTAQSAAQSTVCQGAQEQLDDDEEEMSPEELENAVETSVGAKALRQIMLIHNSIKKVETRPMMANPNVQRLIKTAGEIEAQARSTIILELPRPVTRVLKAIERSASRLSRATGVRRETVINELNDNLRKLDALLIEYPNLVGNEDVIRAKAIAAQALAAPEKCRQESSTVKYVKQQMKEIKSVQQEFDRIANTQIQEQKSQFQPATPAAPTSTYESIYPKL